VAPLPVLAIGKYFHPVTSNQTPKSKIKRGIAPSSTGVKVDVVSNGGTSWIRVNTTKNSRLLAEFREMDSYLTDSESENGSSGTTLAQAELDNSILVMGRALLAAARANPIPTQRGLQTPSVTLRLTRLDTTIDSDPRIGSTVDTLCHMGITVELGERSNDVTAKSDAILLRNVHPVFETSRQINLDLSILIALVSDITHAPLPTTTSDAASLFAPSKDKSESGSQKDVIAQAEADSEKHWRALVEQVQYEMQCGLLSEIHSHLSSNAHAESLADVEFWTTHEARDRCLHIVSKVGGLTERRRLNALLNSSEIPLELAQEEYWRNSRYPINFIPLLPIRVHPASTPPKSEQLASRFSAALDATCRSFLSEEHPHSIAQSTNLQSAGNSASVSSREALDMEVMKRVPVTRGNPRLTTHTIMSMLWGVSQGMTTLTANRVSVKIILHEMNKGGVGFDPEDVEAGLNAVGQAAIWTVDPRSLAEKMRSDYTNSLE